jgi:hypothetical protein
MTLRSIQPRTLYLLAAPFLITVAIDTAAFAEVELPSELTAIFEFSGPQGSREVPATILVDRVTTGEEALSFADILDRQGQRGLLAALRGRGDGRLKLGAIEYGLDLIVARPLDDDGVRLTIVTTRPLRTTEVDLGQASLDYPFGVARFEIDGFGRGEGVFYPTASLRVEADGAITGQQYLEGEGRITNVEKVR